MTNNLTETQQTWANIRYFVTFDFDPYKLNKLHFAKYTRYCSEIFTKDANNIEFLINNRILKLFNRIKLLLLIAYCMRWKIP